MSMFGFMGWVYHFTKSKNFFFTLMNTSMPIVLLTIANSDGVHVVTKFFREMRLKGDVRNALIVTMDSLLTPIFLTSITTVAAFFPLIFMPGIAGEFIGFLPKTLIITLSSSLLVALVINPCHLYTTPSQRDS